MSCLYCPLTTASSQKQGTVGDETVDEVGVVDEKRATPILVMRDKRSKAIYAEVVRSKGIEEVYAIDMFSPTSCV